LNNPRTWSNQSYLQDQNHLCKRISQGPTNKRTITRFSEVGTLD